MAIFSAYRLRHALLREDGIALVEFALVLPVLLLFMLGGIELSRYVLINQELDKANATVADVVAQSSSIQTANLSTLMGAVSDMMSPYQFTSNGKIILSSVARANNSTTVKWQYCSSGSYSATSQIGSVNGTATLPSGFTLSNGEDIVVAEAFYTFTPMFGSQILGSKNLYKTAYFKPRLGALTSYTSSCSR